MEKLLNPSQLAEILNVRPGTIYSWLSRGVDVPYVKIAGTVWRWVNRKRRWKRPLPKTLLHIPRGRHLAAVPEPVFEATLAKGKNGDLNPNRVHKEVIEFRQREARQEKQQEAAKASPKLDSRIIVGDFREHSIKVADGSISLIFTDPPYNHKASEMLPDLAKFAASKLAEGGSLICYVGQTQLPAAVDAFRQHLRYWWAIACIHSGRSTVMREYGINAGWKAVLWFVRGTRDDNSIMVSDVMSGGEEKEYHEWQQAESEASYWIDKLCPPDGLVCDPFLAEGQQPQQQKQRAGIGLHLKLTPTMLR